MKAERVLYLGIGLVLVWGIAEAVGAWHRRTNEYEARAQQAEAFAAQARAYADSVGVRADSLEAENAELALRTARRDTVYRTRYREVLVREQLEPAPDTCAPFIAVRDSIIAEGYALIDSTRAAYDREVVIAGMLRASRDTLRVALDSVTMVLHDRPGKRPWWLPSLGLGPFVGWCQSGPCAGVGAGLTWAIR